MSTPKIVVSDENGHRELEGQELKDFLIEQAKLKAEADELEAKAAAKAAAKSALLDRLGITEDEAKLLLS